MAQTLGLILANRAVVLGAIKARDLLEQTAAAEASGVFDAVWVGDSLLAKPRLEAVAGVDRAAVGAGGHPAARPSRRRMSRDVRAPASGALRPAVGEPRRAQRRPRLARGLSRRPRQRQRGAGGGARRHGHRLRR